jgi:hypothetical protein
MGPSQLLFISAKELLLSDDCVPQKPPVMRCSRWVSCGGVLVVALAACGGGANRGLIPAPSPTVTATLTQTPSPTGTPTPSETPTPTPLVAVFYQLTEGSMILSSPAPAGTNAPTLEEPLTGTFIAVPQPKGGQYCLNTLLCLAVTNFQFHSSHFFVIGSGGQITQSTFQPDFVSMDLTSSINGEPFILGGHGPFDPNSSYPPPLRAIEICAAPPGVGGSCAGIRAGTDIGYDLTIFAAPEG